MSDPHSPSPLAYQAAEKHRLHLVSLISRPPIATWSLIAVLVAVYGGLLYANGQLMGSFGVNPSPSLLHGATWSVPVIVHHEYYRLVSAIFVHASLLHLGLNAYGLYILGPAMEKFYGWQKFLVIFVISGLGGTLATLWWGDAPSVGASGAIFGIIGGTGVIGLKYRELLPRAIAKQMTKGAVILFVANVAIGLTIPQIDMAAHMGGAAAGALVTLMTPSDIGDARRSPLLRNVAVMLVVAISCWGIVGMIQKTSECGASQQSMMECYPELLRLVPASGDNGGNR